MFVGALVLQIWVVADLRVVGVMGDVMLLLAIAAGSVTDPNRGALYGFAAGMTYDLLLDTPLGMSALVYAVVAFGVGAVSGWFPHAGRWFHVVVAVVASLLAVLTMVGLAPVLGLVYPGDEMVRAGAVVAVTNALLILPARGIVSWAVRTGEQDDFWVALP